MIFTGIGIAMFEILLKNLIADRKASAKDLALAAGCGTSTAYRWIKAESKPDDGHLRGIIGSHPSHEVRAAVLTYLAAGNRGIYAAAAEDLDVDGDGVVSEADGVLAITHAVDGCSSAIATTLDSRQDPEHRLTLIQQRAAEAIQSIATAAAIAQATLARKPRSRARLATAR